MFSQSHTGGACSIEPTRTFDPGQRFIQPEAELS
jgi:hypothetical protein